MEPLVSVPRAKSTSSAATAEADPLEEPPGVEEARVQRRAVMDIDAVEAEGQLVAAGLAHQSGARAQEPLYRRFS